MRVLVVNADSSSLKLRLLGGRDEVINSADLPAGDSRSDDSGLAARRFGWIRPAGPDPCRTDPFVSRLGSDRWARISRPPRCSRRSPGILVPGLDAGAGLPLGVRLVPEQELAEPAVQHSHLSLVHRHAA
jgi:hypothetical protein